MRTERRKATLVAVLCLSASTFSAVSTGDDTVSWHCWYELDNVPRIRCVTPDTAVNRPDKETGEAAEFEELRQVIDVPIYALPYSGPEFSIRLARAALCGTRRNCLVVFDDTEDRSVLAAGSAKSRSRN